MKSASLAAATALAWACVAQAEIDPYAARSAPAGSVDALVRDAYFGEPGADAAIQRWLDTHPGAPTADRARLYKRLCNDYGVQTAHAVRAKACAAEKVARGHASADDDQGMAGALKAIPPIRVIGSARVPLTWNSFGSLSADVTVDGVTLPWFMDTGAEVSVLTRSNADRLGVRYLQGNFEVSTSTTPVHGAVGVIDVARIGDAYIENLPVLVLPDEQLTIGGTVTIPGILGLPAFAAFGRMAWLDDDKILALGEAAPPVDRPAGRIYWNDSGVGFPIRTPLGVMGVHFDSGANRTDWRTSGMTLLSAEQKAASKIVSTKTGGAGGIVEAKQTQFPRIEFSIGDAPVVLSKVTVDPRSDDGAARIGMDAVSQLHTLVLDFRRMTFYAEPKAPAASPSSGR